jgi:hypothetical protein
MFVMVFKCFSGVFTSISFVFFCMLQLLHLDVLKVDRVLHMGYAWEVAGGANDVRGGMGDVRGSVGTLLVRSLKSPTR